MITALVLLAALVPQPQPQAAPACVTKAEYAAAPYGPKATVEAKWDAVGTRDDSLVQVSNPNLVTYRYEACRKGDWVVVAYRKRTLQAIQLYYWTSSR